MKIIIKILLIIALGLLFYSSYVQPYFIQDESFIYLSLVWVISVAILKISNTFSALSGLIFLLLSPIFYIFGEYSLAEMSATWAFVFIATGIIISAINYVKSADR